jgi:hypothetical protein
MRHVGVRKIDGSSLITDAMLNGENMLLFAVRCQHESPPKQNKHQLAGIIISKLWNSPFELILWRDYDYYY